MRYFRFEFLVAGIVVAGFASVAALAQKADYSGVGRPPTPQETQFVDRGSGPSGKDLPPGKGTAKEGAQIFLAKCSMCHGADGQGRTPAVGSYSFLRGPQLTGGTGVPLWPAPGNPRHVVTAAYFVAFPTAIYNAIAVSMPMFRPSTLAPDEIYSLTAYILYHNGLIKEDDVMDRKTLPEVTMPDRYNFIPENVEDIPNIEKRGCYKTYGVCP
jgi:S-disulfanyl-L-cysteine oxidoreductase SoxD